MTKDAPTSGSSFEAGQTGEDFTQATEPFLLFESWFAEAISHEPNDPNAMALATVDASGLPNVRMVLLKGLDGPGVPGRGFVFYTNHKSAKGRELAATPKAAIVFHWKSLLRQVRVRGSISPVTADEADEYFASRSRQSRIGAWASDQSRPLESRAALENAVAVKTEQFGMANIPRPQHWSGFRLTPLEIEFWHDRPYRLHDRIVFKRPAATAEWQTTRLYP